jgi:hypothetical protein
MRHSHVVSLSLSVRASDDELGEEIFQEEQHEHGDDEDGGVVPQLSMYLLLRLQ